MQDILLILNCIEQGHSLDADIGFKSRQINGDYDCFRVEMTTGMGSPVGMGIPRESHGSGNKILT